MRIEATASRLVSCAFPVVLAFFLASGFATTPVAAEVVINEIHYDPVDKKSGEEFIELVSTSSEPVDLSGWFFSSGVQYVFPAGTLLEPGAFLVVAEDPAALEASLGYSGALGPFVGHLDAGGELVVLRRPDGEAADQVSYGVGFPWPVAAAGRGSSMELIHPSLDNDLGGSWRASGLIDAPPVERGFIINAEDPGWHYRKGVSEASDPIDAWRQLDFAEDDSWLVGQTPIGFPAEDVHTVLEDMRGGDTQTGYSSVYLRRRFSLPEGEEPPSALKLGISVDDGAVVWINGVEVYRVSVVEGDLLHDAVARRASNARFQDFFLQNPAAYLRPGENVIAIHAFNQRLTGNDFSIDAMLFTPGDEDYDDDFLAFPTPGARNTVYAENAPPQVRQVAHHPQQPPSGQPFLVTARVTDPEGVGEVTLRYQLVAPGRFIPAFLPLTAQQLTASPIRDFDPNPAFEDPANWTAIALRDDGQGGDAQAADGNYSVILPAQANRTLVRYRITAADSRGLAATLPQRDDDSLNFACFVYDGVPAYAATRASIHPDGPGHVYPEEVMRSLPVYHLITRAEDYTQCVAYSGANQIPKSNEAGRDRFNWEAAFVHDGVVYDHIHYRLRQANDRYGGSGKRSFRFRFNKGYHAQLRDDYGRPYPTRWRTINTGKMFDNKRVGNFGLTESMNHLLWNLNGAPAPFVHTFQLRVVQGEAEVPEGPTGQYLGDFQGMHLAFEDYDPRFLDAHGLADGNLYKLKDGVFDGNQLRRNQGRDAVATDEDFQNIRRNLRPMQTDEWLDLHVNYDRWSRYHAVVEGIRHYDFVPADSHSKNRAWYFEPFPDSPFGRLWTLPWDSDASWGPNWNDGVDYSKNAIFTGRGHERFRTLYRNNMREFRDLLWTEEVINTMIDDLAAMRAEIHLADRDRWRAAPAMAGSEEYGPMAVKVQDMKRFAFTGWTGSTGPTVPAGGRARHLDNLANAQGDGAAIPETPVVVYSGPEGFPVDALSFTASEFRDPQPEDVFGAMKWRVGEITPPGVPFDRTRPRVLEVPAVWESDEITTFEPGLSLPPTLLREGGLYRVRVRMMDSTGRWSHWSAPVELTAGAPLAPAAQQAALRITEIMYNPLGDSGFEFIEIQNTSSQPVSLDGVRLGGGVQFDFSNGSVATLGAGEFVVVVNDVEAFVARYGGDPLVAGRFSGSLANEGERIELAFGASFPILAFEYDDAWDRTTDGLGFSLVIVDPRGPVESWAVSGGWRASHAVHGSPGAEDVDGGGGFQLPGDLTQDRRVNIGDVVALLRHAFQGGVSLPCGSGDPAHASNARILDVDGDGAASLTDGVHLLHYLFRSGPPPALGEACVSLEGCPDVCEP